MKNKKFTLSPDGKELAKVDTWKKPLYTGHPENGEAIKAYLSNLKKYEQHRASLIRYTVEGWQLKAERIYMEGVDFEIDYQIKMTDGINWLSTRKEHALKVLSRETRIVAVPISTPNKEKEVDLWHQVEETIRFSVGLDPYRSNKIVDYLKSKYSIFTIEQSSALVHKESYSADFIEWVGLNC